jgi:two-component system sensor histidine kinase SenX3
MSPRRRDQPSIAALERAASEATDLATRSRVQRDRLAAVLAHSVEGVVVVDNDGIEIFRNAAAERFRRARHSDAVADRAIAALLDDARTGASTERELELFGPPRSVLRLRAMPIEDDGRPLGGAVFVLDVSETRRVDSVRRDFVANVSHELKTPIGALELLAETMASETDPDVTRPLAERMVKEAERLGRIVDDLLDLSLIETRDAVSRQPIAVSVLVGEALERTASAADNARIDVQVTVRGDEVVDCDRRLVVSAIANLVDNAVKYSEVGSTVNVEMSIKGTDVVVAVRDRGIGIPGRDLERIFERFYRVDQARSRATGGTGLGLAIVRHVASAHGGDVTVESIEGEGSTFRLILPAGGAETTAREAADA